VTRDLPPATVARLPAYRQALIDADAAGRRIVPSAELAEAVGGNSDQVRKDLSFLATRGIRGVGYEVTPLVDELSVILGLTEERNVVLVGAGNLGRALAAYDGFTPRGFRLVAVLDIDTSVIGSLVGGLPVVHLDGLDEIVASLRVVLGVVAVPAPAAQAVVERLVAAGLDAILNFAPVHVRAPEHVAVRSVDLSTELQMLSFHRARMSSV
jgi:redox-sensing transcriptional repressor